MNHIMDDDFDPLAPMYFDAASPDDVEDASQGGFADPNNIVRVWFADGSMSRVRVSLAWREKLGHRHLDDVFGSAFALARLQVAGSEVDAASPEDLSDVDFTAVARFGGDTFTAFRLAFQNFNQRWQDAVARLEAEPQADFSPAVGEFDGVSVTLNEHGQPVRAAFDEDWLEEADSRDVADHVMEATARAHAAHQPPAQRGGELIQLAREHEILITGLMTSLTGKGRR